MKERKTPKQYKKVADPNSKPFKYYVAKKQGKTKEKAKEIAGYSVGHKALEIEATKTYKAVEKRFYKDILLSKIPLEKITDEQIKVIEQDENLGAKNVAIKDAITKIEPENTQKTSEKVLVILGQKPVNSTEEVIREIPKELLPQMEGEAEKNAEE